jgi:indolepyruvate ferredoxin oxidoreductase
VPAELPTPETIVERRAAFLQNYQDARTAARYRSRLQKIAAAEQRAAPGENALTLAVAHSLFKLMAVKDEYEVARLYTDGSFARQLKAQFDGFDRLEFHLAPPLLARRDKRTGHLRKQSFGPWMMGAFRLLARLKLLRGTPLDPFGWTAERRWERQLLADYEAVLHTIEQKLAPGNHVTAVALASYPQKIRGFGHVKQAQATPAIAERENLLQSFRNADGMSLADAAE